MLISGIKNIWEEKAMDAGTGFDLIVIGGGSGAFAAAIKATELGKSVALCEKGVIGGTCLNRGCVPSKNLLRAAEIFNYSRRQPFKGITIARGNVDFAKLIEQKDELLDELRQEKYLNILETNKNISYFEGEASFLSGKKVQVGSNLLEGKEIIIATGARPQVAPFEGIEGVDFLNSTTAFELAELPESMLIMGGRFVAVEMAQLFAGFGTEVTILQRSSRLVPGEDEDISVALCKYLEEEGIKVITGVKVLKVEQTRTKKLVTAEILGARQDFEGQTLLMATGNTPNTERLNLDAAGVETDGKGFIKTDEFMRTSAPDIFAVGDVVGRMPLVTVAAREGIVAAENAFAGDERSMRTIDYEIIPHAIFTDPNVASVGLKEEEGRAKGLNIVTRTLEMKYVPRARAVMDTRGFIKIVADKETEKILGVHILAREAAEIIHQAVLIIKNSMTVKEVSEKIDVYPTFSEMIKLCAQSFSRDVGQLSCCAG